MEPAIVTWPAVQLSTDFDPVAAEAEQLSVCYNLLGVPISIASNVAEALERVDETYIAFRQAASGQAPAFSARLMQSGDQGIYSLRDSGGYQAGWADLRAAIVDLLDRIVHGVLAELYKRGIYAIHAGAVVYRGAAVIIAGRSGQGKTTLTLGLLRRGMGLLSDEFAILAPTNNLVLAYHRSIHVRPGTPELVPELQFLTDWPQRQLGGGIEWSLAPDDLARAFPGCLSGAAPLRHVILLDGPPRPGGEPELAAVPAALATIELLRGTWAASRDFGGGLARLSQAMNGVSCARLSAGGLEKTIDTLFAWLEANHD